MGVARFLVGGGGGGGGGYSLWGGGPNFWGGGGRTRLCMLAEKLMFVLNVYFSRDKFLNQLPKH